MPVCQCASEPVARGELEGASVFEGAGDGDFVGVLDVRAGGDAGGDARDAESGEAGVGFVGEIAGGGFAFDGGGGGEDEFSFDFAAIAAPLRMTA